MGIERTTSLYGTVKKIGSSQFTFDKIYENRVAMEQAASDGDGVYHSRYVLVSYGDQYTTNNPSQNTSITVNIPASGSIPAVNQTYTVNLNESWVRNYNIDLQQYHNIYDKTVWQKIFEGPTEKYIMVASLNAKAPSLTVNNDFYSIEITAGGDANGETYYTKPALTSTDITRRDRVKVTYPNPKWDETYSNDLIYHLNMPLPLRLHLNNVAYFENGLDATKHYNYTRIANENVIRWEYVGSYPKYTDADFKFHMPILGQTLSDAFDALYGIPISDGQPVNGGTRPTAPSALTTVLNQTDNVGIIGILSRLNFRNAPAPQSGGTYYFHGDWAATATEFGHIENKPILITGVTIGENTHKLVFETNVAVS